ncbi:MAG: hypothetical protein A2Y72_02810 [Chloroflexi bacterium RBG_13_53_26]|nr:MAG: hypothetical protein A2Y72_02810 [Chloroflexi bacterium RBG_13_53_26]
MVRIRVQNELLVINLCSLVLITIISFADIEALRIVLGLPFLLFFSGYALVAALFPRKSDLSTIERITLSITFSIVIIPLIGLILNMVWAIRLYPILVSVTIFIAAMSVAAWYRRRGIGQEDRLHFVIDLPFHRDGRRNVLDRAVSITLAMALVGAMVILVYVIASPKVGERFTEFYIVGAESWPDEIAVGEEATVVLGIINREHGTMSYRVEVWVRGYSLTATDLIELDHGETWEGQIGFVPDETCARTELAQDVNIPYGPLPDEVKSIQVASTQNLDYGDHILIGQEAAQIQEVEDHIVMLTEGLKKYHPSGTEVIEVQKVEFRLSKVRKLGDEDQSSLSLWLGKEHLSASVTNQGHSEASYKIEIMIKGSQREETRVESRGPVVVAVGDEWAQEIAFPFSEIHEVELSLYKDGGLLYRGSESGSYPSLYMWTHMRDNNPGD